MQLSFCIEVSALVDVWDFADPIPARLTGPPHNIYNILFYSPYLISIPYHPYYTITPFGLNFSSLGFVFCVTDHF